MYSEELQKSAGCGIRTHPPGTRSLDSSDSDFLQGTTVPSLASDTYLSECNLTNRVVFAKMATKT